MNTQTPDTTRSRSSLSRPRAWRRAGRAAAALTVAAGTVLAVAPAANATIDSTGTGSYCDTTADGTYKTWTGCFDVDRKVVDTTSGATVGDGKPVRPGDILEFTWTITNHTDLTIDRFYAYNSLQSFKNCGVNGPCIQGDQAADGPDGGVFAATRPYGWSTSPIGYAGITADPRNSFRSAFQADLWKFASGMTQSVGYSIQVPVNAPNGMEVSKGVMTFSSYPSDSLGRFGQHAAGHVFVDAVQVAVTSPADGAVTDSAVPVLSGTAEPGSIATLTADGANGSVCEATTGADGTWSCTPEHPLPAGKHDLTVTSKATDGYTTTTQLAITTPTPDPTPTPTPTPTPDPTPTSAPTPTPTPSSSVVPIPSSTPTTATAAGRGVSGGGGSAPMVGSRVATGGHLVNPATAPAWVWGAGALITTGAGLIVSVFTLRRRRPGQE